MPLGWGPVTTVSLIYIALLFAIAYWGERVNARHRLSGWTAGLSLGVYCTSWAFFGVTAQAVHNHWWLPPTYTGTLLLYLFAFPAIKRLAIHVRRNNITSIADFIATRFGRSRTLAVAVTLVAVAAVIPYIALQLRAVADAINVLTGHQSGYWWQDTALGVALAMALFAMLFASRRTQAQAHNAGLMTAMAFESVVKLIAFWVLALVVIYSQFGSLSALFDAARDNPQVAKLQSEAAPGYVYWVHTLLGLAATLCLPRLFHLAFVESPRLPFLRRTRWLFPAYLVAIGIFTLPLGLAGAVLLGDKVSPDLYVLYLPMAMDSTWLTLLAFLGGLSASTAMVVVATVVLSIMVTNDLTAPLLLRLRGLPEKGQGSWLLWLRRLAMLVVVLGGFFYYRASATSGTLSQMGLMAFVLVAQLFPALLLGLVWRRANSQGARAGLTVGAALWAYCLLLPEGFGLALPGLASGMDAISFGSLVSLGGNLLTFMLVSLATSTSVSEQLQADQFLRQPLQSTPSILTVQDCFELVKRFAGEPAAKSLVRRQFPHGPTPDRQAAPVALVQQVEKHLSAVIGGASMRMVMDALRAEKSLPLSQVASFVDEASQVLRFNQSLLSATIENISQGISVVDRDLRIIAWNHRYLELFEYPAGLVTVGRPVEDLIRFNAERGLLAGDTDQEVQKRLNHLRSGSRYRYQRRQDDGTVLEMVGHPLPGGGFVTTYSDITEFIQAQQQLTELNEALEERVIERTQALQDLNQELFAAKQAVEEATAAKTRFFAAAGHDLLQPFNAAILFGALLKEKAPMGELKDLADNVQSSLLSAEGLLGSLLEITKIEAGAVKAEWGDFALSEVLTPLVREFSALAEAKGICLKVVPTRLWVRSDKKLLRRILQNLLANAVRYTEQGRVLVGIRRQGRELVAWVKDTGPGINKADQRRIFAEFQQLSPGQGLGLGLAITDRLCRLLGHGLCLESEPGRGAAFGIRLPRAAPGQLAEVKTLGRETHQWLPRLPILVMDNDDKVREALKALLESWGARVAAVRDEHEAQALEEPPALLLMDYHLDDGALGVDVAKRLQGRFGEVPCVVHSADQSEQIRSAVIDAGFHFLLKPVKPMPLKNLMRRLLA
ncbi:PAS domain-containing hybrid sensor histidine kinase/response regulator [Gallaecimonas xiamenensis]|uniref:histidine kinase n=1 Tax=Gallaecimonas xiamenensis 3-C-1 TaxID=745411 RepID=K2IZX8_9GAMM|nr:PAS-domain containing protein [Gallaecimonas xiamenensis]EKE68117.1 sensor protein [Gallaecimonas xiamenensis 3-C-1]